jgi:hypothetical protein
MADSKKPRGSELLARRWSKQDLTKLLDIEHDGVSLVEFFPKGIPDPDGGWGTWHVRSDALVKFLEKLYGHGGVIPSVWVFPIGLGPPEGFNVGFQAGSARER